MRRIASQQLLLFAITWNAFPKMDQALWRLFLERVQQFCGGENGDA
jgi:hypothetical protein